MTEMTELELSDFADTASEYVKNTDNLRMFKSQLDSVENMSFDNETFFREALKCTDCESYKTKFKIQFGIDVEATPDGIRQGVEKAQLKISQMKEDAKIKTSTALKETKEKLKNIGQVGLDTKKIDLEDLDANGELNAENIVFENDGTPITTGGKTLIKDTETNSKISEETRLKKFKTYLKKHKYMYASISAFVIADVTAMIVSGKNKWDNKTNPKTVARDYSGCYAMDKTDGDIFFLGKCGYPVSNSIGATCNRCCFDDKFCDVPCDQGLPKTCSGNKCKCDKKTGQCQYPNDLISKQNIIKQGASYFCTFSGDPYSMSITPCSDAYIACGPPKDSDGNFTGGLCTTEIMSKSRNIKGQHMDVEKLQNYSFIPICFQPNDIFLINNIIAENVRYEKSISYRTKIFMIIMMILSILMIVVVFLWYGILFYRKFKKD